MSFYLCTTCPHTDCDHGELASLRQQVKIGRGALELARKQFLFYVDQHMAKVPPDAAKAKVNQDAATACLAALKLMDHPDAG